MGGRDGGACIIKLVSIVLEEQYNLSRNNRIPGPYDKICYKHIKLYNELQESLCHLMEVMINVSPIFGGCVYAY